MLLKTLFIGTLCFANFASAPMREAPTKASTAAAWENIKSMAGEWQGTANDGRKITHRCQVIAAGSVVMEESWFEAHPGQKMVTMYHLDGDKLMLTHYCVAKNQPRLVATEISQDGKSILFTYLDGTNLPTREKGHMDKASYRFTDKETMSSKWTWYQDGKERWMEKFTFSRVKSANRPSGKDGTCH